MGKARMTPQEMIDAAWTRAETAHLHIHPLGEDADGIVCILVESQRDGHDDHIVRMEPEAPTCNCEAMQYKRVPVCTHICTVALRAMRAKKRGSSGVAHRIVAIWGLPKPQPQPLTLR